MTHALVIGRRRKGRPIAEKIRETQARLEAAGWKVDTKLVTRKRGLRRHAGAAVSAGVDVVVAVGGDGAVLQVLQKVAETDVALGIVPMGTGNLLAGNLGVPKDLDKALEVILGLKTRRIDVGRVTVGGKNRFFAVACGVGFDAEVMDATSKSSKLRLGKLAYFASAFRSRGRVRNAPHEVTLDGRMETMQATQVFVANFGRMGMGFEPRLEIKPDDGMLDVIVVRAGGPVEGLLAGWEAIRQKRRGRSRSGRVFRAQAHEVRIATRKSRLVETDGSVIGKTPIDISIRPAALSVLVPAEE